MEQERRSQRSDARQQTRVRPSVTMVDQRKEYYHYEEALKTLRTNIQFAGAEITSILVTSCYPNEGKSDIVSQLAKEMGKAGKKVLLLDADIRKSAFIQRFQIEGEVRGLSQYLSGQVAVRDILYTTNYENVDMIFAGPVAPNPSELLEGKLFARLVEGLSQRYDYILIDTPPMASVIDAAIVGGVCDGAILVIEDGAVGYRTAQKVKAQLEKSGSRVLGAVLNKVEMKKGKYYSYDKYGKYSKYGRYGKY